ncbi:MAG: hypothetical protein OEY09_11595 [Gammaproteobacteria bacterium]|nr:hypothetical protein [Gammaproteobacteria bacterium]
MSMHIYISREGFKETPIPYNEWIEAAQKCDLFDVIEKKDKKGEVKFTVNLKANKKQRLSLTPYGLLHAQNPEKELVEAMFQLAPYLNAKVYSERNKAYESVSDWEKRTKNYRNKRQEQIDEYKRTWYKRKPFWVLIAIIAGLIIGFAKG